MAKVFLKIGPHDTEVKFKKGHQKNMRTGKKRKVRKVAGMFWEFRSQRSQAHAIAQFDPATNRVLQYDPTSRLLAGDTM